MFNLLIKQVPRAIIISLTIFLALQLVRFMMGINIVFDGSLLINFGYTMLYSLSLYFANATVFIFLDSVYKNSRFTINRLVFGFISTFFITILIVFLLRIFEEVIIEKSTLTEYFNNEKATNFIIPVIIFVVVSLGIHAFYFYKTIQEVKVKEQKIIAGTASAKFESLKSQIDPHFLFNSLNVLSSLIEENPDNAQRFTTSLSKIYRYVLEQKDKELVSVEEELAFAKTYMNLLKMRFENSLFYELPKEAINPDAKVVPLSLQLLLENTVKHNVVSEQRPLHIRIFMEDNYLVIENDYQKKEVLQDRQGVGLQNIINRYGIITNRKVLILQNQKLFTVKIPILTKQINRMEATSYNQDTAFFRAKERVEKLKGFYGNLTSYCIIIPILIIINLNSPYYFQWFWFPMLGWGLGLIFQAFETFGYGKTWEEKKIQEILNKDKTSDSEWK